MDTDPNTSHLTVGTVTWSGTASQITSLNLNFGMPLVASTANNPGNYALYSVATGGGVSPSGITLSPSYDPSTFVVTLSPSQPLAANQFYQLVVNGTAPNGIQTLSGTMLAGNGTTPGTNYVVSLATGTSLKYTTAVGDLVSISIRGGGYLNDLIDANGRGIQLQVVGEVPHHTVLTGTVKKGPHGTGLAYLGYTIYGLGNFGDVSVKMYSPPFQVDIVPAPDRDLGCTVRKGVGPAQSKCPSCREGGLVYDHKPRFCAFGPRGCARAPAVLLVPPVSPVAVGLTLPCAPGDHHDHREHACCS